MLKNQVVEAANKVADNGIELSMVAYPEVRVLVVVAMNEEGYGVSMRVVGGDCPDERAAGLLRHAITALTKWEKNIEGGEEPHSEVVEIDVANPGSAKS
jgi:hypothetical protein